MKRSLPVFALLLGLAACDSSTDNGPEVQSVAVTPKTPTIAVGQTQQLNATATMSDGTAAQNPAFNWQSLNTAVATVSGTGLVTGVTSGTAKVVVSLEGKTDTSTVTVVTVAANCDPANTLALAVGQSATVTGAAASTLCLDGQGSGADFALVAFHATENQGASFNLRAQATGGVAVGNTPNPSLAPLSLPSVAKLAAPRLDSDFHLELMRRSRSVLTPLVPAAREAYRSGRIGPRFSVSAAVPAVGDQLTLNTNANDACSNAVNVVGTVKAVSAKAVVVADNNNPAGGLTDGDYQHVAATFDSLVSPVNVANFGEPQDIDANGGRVIILYTRAVNELTPANVNYVIGGFFYARDLFPKSATATMPACESSNAAEMFYMLAADPSGTVNGNVRTRDYVLRQTVATVGHEFQHLISASRRLYVVNAGGTSWDEDVWLNEGMSHIAEELLYYRVTGFEPRQNINLQTMTSSPARTQAYNQYMAQNFGRFDEYLTAPHINGPYLDNDELGVRGAIWAFLRYAADRRAGSDATLWFSLVNTNLTGLANLRSAFSPDIINWFRDWTVANYTDDSGVAGIPAAFTHPSWNFRSIYPGLQGFTQYPLRVQHLASGAPVDVQLLAGGGSFYRVGAPANNKAAVRFSTNGGTPAGALSVTVVRTQ